MIGTNNFSVMRKLSNRNLKNHMVRNLLFSSIILVITLVVLCLCILSSSTTQSMQYTYFQQYGNTSHAQLEGVSKQAERLIAGYSYIKDYGVSISIGNILNDEIGNRTTQFRYGDTNFAQYALAEPEHGRMPQNSDEVALDTSVIKDLGLNREIGSSIILKWLDEDGNHKYGEFIIVGIWNENKICPNRIIWGSKAFAESEGSETLDMALFFRKADDIEAQYNKMIDELNLNVKSCKQNWVYDFSSQQNIIRESLPYKAAIIMVLICGFLVLYNVIQISVNNDIKLYGRMKTMGVTRLQITFSVMRQIHMAAIGGILPGLLLGYFCGSALVLEIVKNISGNTVLYVTITDYAAAALLAYLTIMLAGIKAAQLAGRIDPSEIINEENNYNFSKKGFQRTPGLPAIFQMSITNTARYKKRNIITIAILTLGLLCMSCIFVIKSSFDINKYMDEVAISDFTITEKSLVQAWGNYNVYGDTISEDVMKLVDAVPGIKEKGSLYFQNELIELPKAAVNNITAYYEQNNANNLEYMKQDKAWSEGYYRMKETHQCMVSVFGMSGLATEQVLEARVLDGIIDKAKFMQGGYAIANGFSGQSGEGIHQPTYNVGSEIEAGGKKFEIMAVVEAPYPITEGKVDSGAEFNLSFFIPDFQFKEMYPDNTIRKLFFNVNEEDLEAAEIYAGQKFRSRGIPVVSQKTLSENYETETRAATMMQDIVAAMFLIIGIVNFLNSIIVSIDERKKEFAIMQGIGMTIKQLRFLLCFESLNIVGVTLILSYFFSLIAISSVIKAYLSVQWTASYCFTITPLLVMTPILILISIILPLICLEHMRKSEIMDRILCDDEMQGSC